MRKLSYLLLVLLAIGVLGSVAATSVKAPNMCEEPKCPEGWVTIKAAEWVPPVPAVTHQEHKHKPWHGGWGNWEMGSCHIQGWDECQERTVIDTPEVPGYWKDPVCYEPCSQTGEAVYGEWSAWTVDPADASKLIRSRSVTYYDSNNVELVCKADVKTESMDRPICQWDPKLYADDPLCVPPEPVVRWDTGADCAGWYAKLYIDDALIGEKSGVWAGEENVSVTIGEEQSPVIDNPNLNPNMCEVPPKDLCTNLDGVQEVMPEGYEDPDEDGICTKIPPPPTDMCPNLDGIQETVPDGMIIDAVTGNCFTPSTPPADTGIGLGILAVIAPTLAGAALLLRRRKQHQ